MLNETLTTYLNKQQENNQPIPNSSYILEYFEENAFKNSSPHYKNRRKAAPLLENTGQGKSHILCVKTGRVEEPKQPKQKKPSFSAREESHNGFLSTWQSCWHPGCGLTKKSTVFLHNDILSHLSPGKAAGAQVRIPYTGWSSHFH